MQRAEMAKIPAPGMKLMCMYLAFLFPLLFVLFYRRSATEIRGLPLEASAQALCMRSTMRRITYRL